MVKALVLRLAWWYMVLVLPLVVWALLSIHAYTPTIHFNNVPHDECAMCVVEDGS